MIECSCHREVTSGTGYHNTALQAFPDFVQAWIAGCGVLCASAINFSHMLYCLIMTAISQIANTCVLKSGVHQEDI